MLATTINRYLGSSAASECRVPAGAVVCEFKYCEVCGKPFVREFAPTEVCGTYEYELYSVALTIKRQAVLRRDHGARFCKDCRGRQLEPDVAAQEAYREQLPDAREAKKRRVYQMPDYRALNPVGRSTQSHQLHCRAGKAIGVKRADLLRRAAETRVRVREAFALSGRLSAEQLQEIIPGCYRLSDVHQRLLALSIHTKLVGRERREGIRGAGIGVYELESVN